VYYLQFINKYCNYWGNAKPNILAELDYPQFFSKLYSSVSVKVKSKTLPTEIGDGFSVEFQKALQSTPFYNPKGNRNLSIDADASFGNEQEKSPTTLTQEYTTQEPYTAYVPVLKSKQVPYASTDLVVKTKQVPYTSYLYQYDIRTGASYSVPTTQYRTETYLDTVPTTKYRTEFYTENEPVTRYKTIPHVYTYEGLTYRQNLALVINAKTSVDKNKIVLSLNKQETAQGIAHNENLPDIGLTPKQISLIEPVDWIKSKSEILGLSLHDELQSLWIDLYCKPPEQGAAVPTSGEAVHKCIKANGGENYGFVNQWYTTYIGLPYSEAKMLFRD